MNPAPNEVKFLHLVAGMRVGYEFTPNLVETWGRNWKKHIQSLIDSGYLKLSDSFDDVDLLTANKLKEILTSRGISTAGRKIDLVKRVRDNLDKQEIDSIAPACNRYLLSDKGQSFIKRNEAYLLNYLHRYGLLESEISKMDSILSAQGRGFTQPDVIYGALLERLTADMLAGKWSSYSLDCSRMAKFLDDEHQNMQAIQYSSIYLFLLLSGLSDPIYDDSPYVAPPSHIYVNEKHLRMLSSCVISEKLDDESLQSQINYFTTSVAQMLPFYYYEPSDAAIIIIRLLKGISLPEARRGVPHKSPSKDSNKYKCLDACSYEDEEDKPKTATELCDFPTGSRFSVDIDSIIRTLKASAIVSILVAIMVLALISTWGI